MTDQPAMGDPDPSALVRVWHEPADGGGVVVHVAGDVDLTSVGTFVDELVAVEKQLRVPGPLVINLTEVTFLASVGLSVLVECHTRNREAGVELRVVAGNKTVSRTITVTGLNPLLTMFGTLPEALNTVR